MPAKSIKSDTAKLYDEVMEKELDKEIIKSQRKMTAGKDAKPASIKPKKPVQEKKKKKIAVKLQPGDEVEIPEAITVKEFSEKTGLNPVKVIGELMKNGILANINQTIDFETASIIADDFGIKLKRKRTAAAIEDISTGNLETLIKEADEKDLVTRPPIVTVMGHVDHGKTKLLDAIRETDVVSGEAGGITQHIGAYQVEKNGRKITFIDTPGHEAFASMRSRGAKITDIVILVVAADEGVKPQTIEALNHAKEAQVPIIVAINKIDKENINIDRVKAQLAELGLQPEDWGGKTIMAPVSAMTGEGIPMLLEMILLVADMENFKANPNRPAVATIVETHLDKNLGPVATVLVNTGTLRVSDAVVVGNICGRIKLMKNYFGTAMQSAPPAMPVRIAGLEAIPHVGDILQVVGSFEEARKKASQVGFLRDELMQRKASEGIEKIMSAIQEGKLKTLKIVLKADALGSLEAIKQALAQIKHENVSIKVIHCGVGAVSESDVMMASSANGVLVSFNSIANSHVQTVAAREGIQIFTYNIIYKLIDDVKKILSGLLEPEVIQATLGRAEIRKIFMTERKSIILGCKVLSGKVENKSRLRVFRGENQIGEGFLESLKKINDIVHEVGEGGECGIKFTGDVKSLELKEGDILESWKEERKTRLIV
ncbi:translation initiation factor IF-2 [Candidatus Peregrinibacteria bacterium]|nr:translation initiation factor IF-2 [Candidatus Peregrinibacteria bacterium]